MSLLFLSLVLSLAHSFVEIKHGSVRTRGHKPPWDKKEKVAEAAKMNIEFTHELV